MEFIGICCFIALCVGFAIVTKEAMKLKKENQQLHKDLDFVLQHVPTASIKELEQIKLEYLNEEEKNG